MRRLELRESPAVKRSKAALFSQIPQEEYIMQNYSVKIFSFFLLPFFAFGSFQKADGNELCSSDTIKKPAVILDLVTTPLVEDENPEFINYEISGRIFLGNNRCRARGYSAKILTHQDNEHKKVVHVRAILLVDKDDKRHPRFCTQEYNPIYEDFSIEVRAEKIVIHNVDRMKNDLVLDATSSQMLELPL